MPDAPPSPQPFAAQATPSELDDLRARLRATRWPDAPEDAGWSLGTDLGYLRELVEYWADGFDWPAQEAALAEHPRYRVRLGELTDSLRPRPRGADRSGRAGAAADSQPWVAGLILALHQGDPLLTDPGAHGADPADAFDVVVPDMPGYGYSDRPTGAALNSIAVAGRWAELMTVLGYPRFVAAGGDIGSHVSRYLALDHPDRVVAVHRTDAGVPVFTGNPAELEPAERAFIDDALAWGQTEGAYAAMHRTKPQTAAIGLTDSPAGLAAWIVEKLRAWSDCDGDIERSFSKDEILTNITLYWLTGTIGSSMRMYRANAAIPPAQLIRRVRCRRAFRCFPATSSVHRGNGWTEPRMSCGSPSRHAAGISRPSRSPSSTRRNCAISRPIGGSTTGCHSFERCSPLRETARGLHITAVRGAGHRVGYRTPAAVVRNVKSAANSSSTWLATRAVSCFPSGSCIRVDHVVQGGRALGAPRQVQFLGPPPLAGTAAHRPLCGSRDESVAPRPDTGTPFLRSGRAWGSQTAHRHAHREECGRRASVRLVLASPGILRWD